MKKIVNIFSILFLSSVFVNVSNAQSIEDRSSLSASFGLSLILNTNVNYSYQIKEKVFLSIGAGQIVSVFGGSVPHIDFIRFFLRGKTHHKFEFGYGMFVFFESKDIDLFPNIRLGYRNISKNNNATFFRIGVSLSEGFYIGKGFSF